MVVKRRWQFVRAKNLSSSALLEEFGFTGEVHFVEKFMLCMGAWWIGF